MTGPSDPASDTGKLTARAPRTNLLLAATIEAGAIKTPVRIRNMSESGAMIEGAAFPAIGATLILRRLEVGIGGTVIWRAAGRCGIRFDGQAVVADWVAGVARNPGVFDTGQARVDAIQAAIRTGQPIPAGTDPKPSATGSTKDLDHRLAEELAYVRRLLDGVGGELSDDGIILQRHARMLQSFDVACQILEHLQTILSAPDRAEAVKAVTMQDLRARLLRKPMF
jgi:hypothetical protein